MGLKLLSTLPSCGMICSVLTSLQGRIWGKLRRIKRGNTTSTCDTLLSDRETSFLESIVLPRSIKVANSDRLGRDPTWLLKSFLLCWSKFRTNEGGSLSIIIISVCDNSGIFRSGPSVFNKRCCPKGNQRTGRNRSSQMGLILVCCSERIPRNLQGRERMKTMGTWVQLPSTPRLRGRGGKPGYQ